MEKIKKGDMVGRKSYNKDIIFKVSDIIEENHKRIAILTGLIERIEADSPINDLEKIEEARLKEKLKEEDLILESRIQKSREIIKQNNINKKDKLEYKIITGKILHLDGDKKYTDKSYRYYKKVGLNAIVKNIPEYRQPRVVYKLLEIYKPDILIITGHDGMIKKGTNFYNIFNYRNSRYFVETVKEARRYDKEKEQKLVIFAGACQSYFEAIMSAGANFASSPARILLDFLDPLVIAQKVALTERYKYITIDDIARELRDGKNGINGIGASGKMVKVYK